MKIRLEFNSRSHSSSIQKAIKIAESFDSIIDNHMVIVEVEELSGDFINLIWMVAHLSKTNLLVDGIEIDSRGYKLREVLTCPKYNRCKGNCSLYSHSWDEITYQLGLREREENEEYSLGGFDESVYDRFGKNVIIDINQDEFTIDRDNLLKAYHEHFQLEKMLCSKFKESIYLNDIRAFSKQQTFKIPEKEDLFSIDDAEIEKFKKKELQERQELIDRIGDEVEKRVRKIFSELYKNNGN